MKTNHTAILLALLASAGVGVGAASVANADPAKAQKLTYQQKEEIAEALKILESTGTLVAKPNQCVRFDPDIIQMLQHEGLLTQTDSVLLSVCDGMSPRVK